MPSEPVPIVTADETADWQVVAHELADALRTTILRNPNLNAGDWDRASAALGRYAQRCITP